MGHGGTTNKGKLSMKARVERLGYTFLGRTDRGFVIAQAGKRTVCGGKTGSVWAPYQPARHGKIELTKGGGAAAVAEETWRQDVKARKIYGKRMAKAVLDLHAKVNDTRSAARNAVDEMDPSPWFELGTKAALKLQSGKPMTKVERGKLRKELSRIGDLVYYLTMVTNNHH
jgi:hypothetical protein